MNPWNTKLTTNNFSIEELSKFKSIYSIVNNLVAKDRFDYVKKNREDYISLINKIKYTYESGYGLKLIAREFKISYSEIRTYFK